MIAQAYLHYTCALFEIVGNLSDDIAHSRLCPLAKRPYQEKGGHVQ